MELRRQTSSGDGKRLRAWRGHFRGQIGEIAGTVGERWHGDLSRIQAFDRPRPLIVPEKEDLLFLDRAAQRATVLILYIGVSYRRKVGPRIEIGVAEKVEALAVNAVRPAFGYHGHDAASIVTIFRIETVGQHAEFVNGIQIRDDTGSAVHLLFDVGPVDEKTVGVFALAAN